MRFIFSTRCRIPAATSRFATALSLLALIVIGVACDQFESHAPQKYFSETRVPVQDEFRWSNGSAIKTIDPALAFNSPESDVVRAIYEGLTDLNPETLDAIPSIAESWTQSVDGRVWIFTLRDDARWSNGDVVTAHDFVRSWKRLATEGLPVSLSPLVTNINGLSESKSRQNDSSRGDEPSGDVTTAIDDFILQVVLAEPDTDLPKVLSHQIFRPVHSSFDAQSNGPDSPLPVTNGAFRIESVSNNEILLGRSSLFWDADQVGVARVRFVMSQSAEQALDDYRAGRLDAVTNFDFEPLALKLLSSYSDFRRSNHSAVNLYEFNVERAPFSDERVREAFSLALARERLVQSETSGAMGPATSLTPFTENFGKVAEDVARAKVLMAEAGFPEGKDFPQVTLVVNRNDLQARVARFAARAWKAALGVEVRIETREMGDIEAVRRSGEFDMIRRGVVFPTPSIKAAQDLIFDDANPAEKLAESRAVSVASSGESVEEKEEIPFAVIALYFPKSYSLVKPSVRGFSVNSFGASPVKKVTLSKSG